MGGSEQEPLNWERQHLTDLADIRSAFGAPTATNTGKTAEMWVSSGATTRAAQSAAPRLTGCNLPGDRQFPDALTARESGWLTKTHRRCAAIERGTPRAEGVFPPRCSPSCRIKSVVWWGAPKQEEGRP